MKVLYSQSVTSWFCSMDFYLVVFCSHCSRFRSSYFSSCFLCFIDSHWRPVWWTQPWWRGEGSAFQVWWAFKSGSLKSGALSASNPVVLSTVDPAQPSLVVPEVQPPSAALPIMAVAILCIWARHNSPAPTEAAASATAPLDSDCYWSFRGSSDHFCTLCLHCYGQGGRLWILSWHNHGGRPWIICLPSHDYIKYWWRC